MPTPATLTEKLRMTHLEEGLDGLKKSVEDAARITSEKPDAESDADPRNQEVYPFTFDFIDARKKRWTGDFVNHILTIEEEGYVAIMRSRLQGGQPIASIDDGVSAMNLAISHMTYSLDPKKRPDWAQGDGLLKMKDPSVIFDLYAHVRSHVDYFRSGGKDQDAS